jgi:hypothetical protein
VQLGSLPLTVLLAAPLTAHQQSRGGWLTVLLTASSVSLLTLRQQASGASPACPASWP